MSDGLRQIWESIPLTARVLAVLAGATAFGWSAHQLYADRVDVIGRLQRIEAGLGRLETKHSDYDISQLYFHCRADRADAGQDPAACRVILDQLNNGR